jgi:hypothetical protein
LKIANKFCNYILKSAAATAANDELVRGLVRLRASRIGRLPAYRR